MNQFIGRKKELAQLKDVQKFDRPCLVVVRGRRRIGKSRLIKEFSKGNRFLAFTGIAPTDATTPQDQRDEFAHQLAKNTGTAPDVFTDWSAAFNCLTGYLTHEPTVILFDEISWMGSKDHLFVSKLTAWWDLHLADFSHLTLVFCGSVSTWIEKNIIRSTSFFGRITLNMDLEQLSLSECAQFLHASGVKASPYDTFKLLAVTGGVPWYFEQIDKDISIDKNIRKLCFEKGGLLIKEFDYIFHDLFNGHSSLYKKIIYLLADGMKDLQGLQEYLDAAHKDSLEVAVQDLIIAGFVSQHYSWSFKTEKITEQTLYRLSDNYLRFYVKYIEPNIKKIDTNTYQEVPIQSLSNWDAIMGLQVESLLLNNRSLLLKALDIHPVEIVGDNPYLQRSSAGLKSCQIDYLVQTKTQTLYVCEFKFKRQEIGPEIIESMQEKISRLSIPKGFGAIPVLFHFGGVKDSVQSKSYFYRIINVQDFLEAFCC